MELTVRQVKGNTWCIQTPMALVPFYRLNKEEIILLDSGGMLHGELEAWLLERHLHVRAILNTHNHWDHVAANTALQRRDGARIYMPKLEAALQLINFERSVNCGVDRNYIHLFGGLYQFTVDEEIALSDGELTVLGQSFEVIHTPGHSADHVAYITPDHVLYVGDAALSADLLPCTKLSYAANYQQDIASKKKLKQYRCSAYIMAHCGITEEIEPLIDTNIRYIEEKARQICDLVQHPMTLEEITRSVWRNFEIQGGSTLKMIESASIVHGLVDYLIAQRKLRPSCSDGLEYYEQI